MSTTDQRIVNPEYEALKGLDDARLRNPAFHPARRITSFEPDQDYLTQIAAGRMEHEMTGKALREASTWAASNRFARASARLERQLAKSALPSSRIILQTALARYALALGRQDEAEQWLLAAQKLAPDDNRTLLNLAGLYNTENRFEEALALLRRVRVTPTLPRNQRFNLNFNLACAYAGLGYPRKALPHLDRAAGNDPVAAWTSLGDPNLDPLRKNPRFQQIERELEKRNARP